MLPQGYTRVEWIESTGTQYIDTGFKPNQDTRIVMDAIPMSVGGTSGDCGMFFGSGYPVQQKGFEAYAFGGMITGVYNGVQKDGSAVSAGQRVVIDFNKNVCKITADGKVVLNHTFTAATFTSDVNLALFVIPRQSKYYGRVRAKFCQIYGNGTIVRGYMPCIDENGDANLWDDVNETLAEKVGIFLYGAPVVPEPLSGLVQINAQAGAAFSWNPSENANEYVIARDGVKIATVYGNVTSYTDADAPGKSTYTVTPYNGTQAGTGASITILTKLDTPVNLKASLDDRTVTLTWNAVSGAEGYRVYRDGEVVASVTSTTYTDTLTPPASVAYAVSAYAGTIQSELSQTVVVENWEGVLLALITDRTAADVAEAKRLRDKLIVGEALTDEESARYFAGLRGAYNASDMNRVGAAVKYVANRLNAEGYGAYVSPKTDWEMSDIVRQSDWNAYLDDVKLLRARLTLMRTTPNITDAMYSGIDWREANDIEQILVDLNIAITCIIRNYIFSGEVFAGEV